MVEERGGWFIKNVRDATWSRSEAFGLCGSFDNDPPCPQTGVRIFVIDPGKPNCRYHREEAQEDFLVLSGRCKLLINGEEHALREWDYVHCPPGATHVMVGDGDGPCAVLAIGHRPGQDRHHLFYPASEMAKRYDAEAPEPTPDPRVAYSDLSPREPTDPPDWPLR